MARATYSDKTFKAGGDHTSRMLPVHRNLAGARWTTGFVVTAHGVVGVYMEERHTRLSVVSAGREFTRYYTRDFREPALITLAKRFAAEASDAA